MELRYFLMDSAFNSTQNEGELKVPINAADRFDVNLVEYTADKIPAPYNNFVRIGSSSQIGFSDQTVQELNERSIAMNPSVEEMALQVKKNNRFNMTHMAMRFGGVLMAAGGIVSIRKKKQ